MQNFLLKYLNKNKNKIAYIGFIFFFIIILDFAIDIIQTRKKKTASLLRERQKSIDEHKLSKRMCR